MAISAVFYIVTMTVSPKQNTLSSPGGCFVFLFSFLLCLYTCILFIFEILLTPFSFLWICSNFPLSSTYRLPPSPCPRTAYGFHSFWYNKQVIHFKTMNSFFLSRCFPLRRWQANCVFRSIATRKHNETLCLWPGSAEPYEAIGASLRIQVRTFNTRILCQILHFVQEWQAGI